jgi:hypothetical protein
MRPTTALAPLAAPVLGIPAALAGILPSWAQLALLTISALLAAAQVVTTQIIRLRASNRIARSQDNLRILEIQDLPHRRQLQAAPLQAASTAQEDPKHSDAPTPTSRSRIRHRFETDHARHGDETRRNPHVKHDRHARRNENLHDCC